MQKVSPGMTKLFLAIQINRTGQSGLFPHENDILPDDSYTKKSYRKQKYAFA
jgi:hypothetical protein